MKNSIFIFCLAFFLLSSASCNSELKNDNTDARSVVVFFPTQTHSLLKSTANDDEELIEEVLLFGVDADNNVIQDFIINTPSSGGEPVGSVLRKVKSFYAIANPSDELKEEKPKTLSDLEKITGSFAKAPKKPFLMSGKGAVNSFSASIELVRTMAKVNIFSKDAEFKIQSVTVSNTPDEGYVFKKESFAVPESAERISYSTVVSSNPTLYIAENNKLDPTVFIVSGTVDGVTRNYSVELKKDAKYIDIVRNTHYQIGIAPINESEADITISLPEWNDVKTDNHSVPRPVIENPYKNGIKILAIGNSYSSDVMQYLWDLLQQAGVDQAGKGANIKLVNIYQSGASFTDHANNLRNGTKLSWYIFDLGSNGHSSSGPNTNTIEQIIKQDKWDVITMQQSSDWSFRPDKWVDADLNYLISEVKKFMTDNANPNRNPNYKLAWHMTWSYAQTYIDKEIGWIGSHAENPYDLWVKICDAVKLKIVPRVGTDFAFIIPAGTAIQNARKVYGDVMNIDGTHLNNLGRYISGAMWAKAITGDNLNLTVPYEANRDKSTHPSYTIQATDRDKIVKAVNDAYASKFESPK